MKVACTRRLTFEAGHRVMGHEGKCAHPHGHGYKIEVTAEAEQLDSVGRVIDFSVLKETIGKWVDNCWDHGFIYHQDDKAVLQMLDAFDGSMARLRSEGLASFNRDEAGRYQSGAPAKRFAMPYNPTAENLARYLLEEVCPNLLHRSGVRVTRVICRETDNCSAEASL